MFVGGIGNIDRSLDKDATVQVEHEEVGIIDNEHVKQVEVGGIDNRHVGHDSEATIFVVHVIVKSVEYPIVAVTELIFSVNITADELEKEGEAEPDDEVAEFEALDGTNVELITLELNEIELILLEVEIKAKLELVDVTELIEVMVPDVVELGEIELDLLEIDEANEGIRIFELKVGIIEYELEKGLEVGEAVVTRL